MLATPRRGLFQGLRQAGIRRQFSIARFRVAVRPNICLAISGKVGSTRASHVAERPTEVANSPGFSSFQRSHFVATSSPQNTLFPVLFVTIARSRPLGVSRVDKLS